MFIINYHTTGKKSSSINLIKTALFELSKRARVSRTPNTALGLNEAAVNILISDCYFSLFRHLDFFEMVRNEDDSELAKRFDMVSNLELL